jgi:hypothetical protein
LDRSLGGSQNRAGRGVEDKNSQPLPGIETRLPCGIRKWSSDYATSFRYLKTEINGVKNNYETVRFVHTRPFAKFVDSPSLLLVGTLWRCGDGLFFEVPPLSSDAFLATLHPLLESVLQTVDHFEISCLEAPSFFMFGKAQKSRGARSELNSVFSLENVDPLNPIRTPTIQSRSRPMQFLGFSNHEKELRYKNFEVFDGI